MTVYVLRRIGSAALGLAIAVLLVTIAAAADDAPKQPLIQRIVPSLIARGDTITIEGQNLVSGAARTRVRVGSDWEKNVEVKADGKVEVKVNSCVEAECQRGQGEYSRDVVVTVGDLESNTYTIRQLSWCVLFTKRVALSFAAFVIVIAAVLLQAQSTALKSETNQWSLSKIQMALWTLIFGLSYILLSAAWKEFLDLSQGMFWLMGISATTAVGAKAIVLKNLDKLDPYHPSKLLKDWDKNLGAYRLSLHRCQIALWTVIVASIFVIRVIDTMHLPEIPDQLLLLMGVSGGAYLGFNYPKTP